MARGLPSLGKNFFFFYFVHLSSWVWVWVFLFWFFELGILVLWEVEAGLFVVRSSLSHRKSPSQYLSSVKDGQLFRERGTPILHETFLSIYVHVLGEHRIPQRCTQHAQLVMKRHELIYFLLDELSLETAAIQGAWLELTTFSRIALTATTYIVSPDGAVVFLAHTSCLFTCSQLSCEFVSPGFAKVLPT